jgi:multidrug efflux system membrane fusion protein
MTFASASALSLSFFGYYLGTHHAPYTAAAKGAVAVYEPTIMVAVSRNAEVPIVVKGIGEIGTSNDVQIKSRVDGYVQNVLFTEGNQVKAGETLIQIDPRPYRAAVLQAEGQVERDQAQYRSAKADLDRILDLAARGFASKQAIEQHESAVAALQASLKMDEAALDISQLNLSFTTIRAPISGRIGKRLVDAGNLVRSADAVSLAEVVRTHPMTGSFTIPEDSLPAVRARMQAGPLAVDAVSPDTGLMLAQGRLLVIDNHIDHLSGNAELKAQFDNADDRLWAGQLFEARMVVASRRGVSVPTSAIFDAPDGKAVFVIDDTDKVALRRVVVGLSGGLTTLITGGLDADERVAISKLDMLVPQQRVSIQSAAAN